MDTRLPVTLNADGCYSIPKKKIKKISLNKIGHMIREGYAISVKTYLKDGACIDITHETLTKIAICDDRGSKVGKDKVIAVLESLQLAEQISQFKDLAEEVLYLIIENGGLEEYLMRKARGMVQYDS